jgi:hypothetical protein
MRVHTDARATVAGKGLLQRDLATPPPARTPPAQPDLTDEQIQQAIRFNRARYDKANTRLIQEFLGGPVTGEWTEENILAVAATQEEYGLTKDGMVGFETFLFLNREQRLEKEPTSDARCLTAFQVIGPDTPTFRRTSPTECHVEGHFRTAAQFSSRCTCSQFQYRQFIRGHFTRTRGGTVTDQSDAFDTEPAGRLTPNFQPDGDTSNTTAINYGHRDNPPVDDPEDHYINDRLADDQANGCRYESEDTPGGPVHDCQPGDVYDLFLNFRGEIQRNGRPVRTEFWTAINRRFVAPP